MDKLFETQPDKMLHTVYKNPVYPYIRIRIPVYLRIFKNESQHHSKASEGSHAVTQSQHSQQTRMTDCLRSEKFTKCRKSWAIVVISGVLFTLTYRSEQFWKQDGGTYLS